MYFSAFGDAIIGEISLLDVIAVDRLKSNFISSISRRNTISLYVYIYALYLFT